MAPPASPSTHANRNILPPPPPPPPFDTSIAENEPSNTSVGMSIESSLQLLAENITDDLNTLDSLQVVSNMLDGGFRNELEDLMMVCYFFAFLFYLFDFLI